MVPKIISISGKAIPLCMNDVDTDLIIPAQYLTGVERSGYGRHLFQRLKEGDKNFIFNQKKFADANILITGRNFGCGSSREHAVWALLEAGIHVVIAQSFADIFFNNSAKNGLFLLTLPKADVDKMLALSQQGDYQLRIDIEQQVITTSGDEVINFMLEPFRKYCFLHGLDELDYLLEKDKLIQQFQKDHIINNFVNNKSVD